MKYLFICILLCCVGCTPDPIVSLGHTPSVTPPVVETSPTFKSGQIIVYVGYSDFTAWLLTHTNIKIDVLCPIDKGPYGSTSGFVIVYEDL